MLGFEKKAYFFVWTPKGSLVIPVNFDASLWESTRDRIDEFYATYVVPELVRKAAK